MNSAPLQMRHVTSPPGRGHSGHDLTRAREDAKESRNEQKCFTQRRKVAEDAKRTKPLSFALLCALASLREIVYFFTPSDARATRCGMAILAMSVRGAHEKNDLQGFFAQKSELRMTVSRVFPQPV
jgi:hypothetical protein